MWLSEFLQTGSGSRWGVDEMQFEFTKGKGTTDAIFIVRQIQEKHLGRGKKLY